MYSIMAKSNKREIGYGSMFYKKWGSWLSTLSNAIFVKEDTGEESENNDGFSSAAVQHMSQWLSIPATWVQ